MRKSGGKSIDQNALKKGSTFKVEDINTKSLIDKVFIYKIQNFKTNKFYIGQTSDILARLRSHVSSKLTDRLGSHYDWKVSILEVVSFNKKMTAIEARDASVIVEKLYIDKYKDNPLNVNLATSSDWHKANGRGK